MRYGVHNFHGNEAPVDGGTGGTPTPLWERPTDWIPMPSISPTEEKVAALFAVHTLSSRACIKVTDGVAIDWGDGTPVQEVVGGGYFAHDYDYSSATLVECSRGYKQAMIVITPLTDAHIVSLSFGYAHTRYGWAGNSAPDSGFLDISISSTYLYSLNISRIAEDVYAIDSGTSNHDMLERVRIVSSGLSSTQLLFASCKNLRSVEISNSPGIASWTRAFYNCSSLVEIIGLDLSGCTSVSNMFSKCYSLKVIPSLSTTSVTDFSNMLEGCSSLSVIPNLDTSLAGAMNGAFMGCRSVVSAPALNIPLCVNIDSLFDGCYNLLENPEITTNSVEQVSYAYRGCRSLRTLTQCTFPVSTIQAIGVFTECNNLITATGITFSVSPATPYIGQYQTMEHVNLETLLADCKVLEKCEVVANPGSFPFSVYSHSPVLREAGLLTLPINRGLLYGEDFYGCPALSKINMVGVKDSLDLSGLNLSKASLLSLAGNMVDDIYSMQTVKLTGVYGVDQDVIDAFTAKGRSVEP